MRATMMKMDCSKGHLNYGISQERFVSQGI
jgi:hypothetical protein